MENLFISVLEESCALNRLLLQNPSFLLDDYSDDDSNDEIIDDNESEGVPPIHDELTEQIFYFHNENEKENRSSSTSESSDVYYDNFELTHKWFVSCLRLANGLSLLEKKTKSNRIRRKIHSCRAEITGAILSLRTTFGSSLLQLCDESGYSCSCKQNILETKITNDSIGTIMSLAISPPSYDDDDDDDGKSSNSSCDEEVEPILESK